MKRSTNSEADSRSFDYEIPPPNPHNLFPKDPS